jgi:hypothetical protein
VHGHGRRMRVVASADMERECRDGRQQPLRQNVEPMAVVRAGGIPNPVLCVGHSLAWSDRNPSSPGAGNPHGRGGLVGRLLARSTRASFSRGARGIV